MTKLAIFCLSLSTSASYNGQIVCIAMDNKHNTGKWIAILATCLCLGGCSKGGNNYNGNQDTGFIQVPGYGEDNWVTDSDIQDSDLDLLLDLGVKMEFMQWQFVKMLSNNFEGDRLFCGSGDRSDPDPTVHCFTHLMADADAYQGALERLGMSNLMTPTTKGNMVGNLKSIFTAGMTEGQKVREEIQDNLMHMRSGYDQAAQQQLYDFYVEMEPTYAKKIGASDARDFFKKLNNGELDAYAVNIAHIWRDGGIRYSSQTGNRVGDYAVTAFTGNAQYLESAYRVSGKVAVSLGELYLTGIDNLAGGYGAKIIELGETIQTKLEALRLAAKVLEGKPDWQGMNKYLVNSIMGDVKEAVKDALGGDDMNFGEDILNQIAENMVDKFSEMCTESSADEAESGEEQEQVGADAKEGDLAILDIYADFGEEAKLIIITDDATGTVSMGRPDVHGRLTVATTPGSKTLTVTKSNGQRLTKKVVAKMGFNTILLKFPQNPYISANYNPILLRFDETEEYSGILTNCRYVKINYIGKPAWLNAHIDVFGESVRLTVQAEINNTGAERTATLELQGYNEQGFWGRPLATCKVVVRQYEEPENYGSISADRLEYGSEGGKQTVKLTSNTFTKYGYFVSNEYKNWIKANLEGGGSIGITVQPNTGAQREGEVICYLTNEENPTEDQKVKFPVRIVQAAGTGVGSFARASASFWFQDATSSWSDSKGESGSINNDSYSGGVSVSGTVSMRQDSGVYVITAYQESDDDFSYEDGPWKGHDVLQMTITFTAGNPANPETYIIHSAECKKNRKETPNYAGSDGDYWDVIDLMNFSGVDIPFTKRSDGNKTYEFSLKGEDVPLGMTINGSHYYKCHDDLGSSVNDYWRKDELRSFNSNDKNSLKVTLTTK